MSKPYKKELKKGKGKTLKKIINSLSQEVTVDKIEL